MDTFLNPNKQMQVESAENIKIFLINQLKFTPRRILFEEFDKKLRLRAEELKMSEKNSNLSFLDSKSNFLNLNSNNSNLNLKPLDLKLLQELKNFRLKNPKDCMSEINLRKFSQKFKEDEKFLQHKCIHRFELNDRLILVPVKSDKDGNSLCLLCGKVSEENQINKSILIKGFNMKADKNLILMNIEKDKNFDCKSRKSFYENSVALMQQKMKY